MCWPPAPQAWARWSSSHALASSPPLPLLIIIIFLQVTLQEGMQQHLVILAIPYHALPSLPLSLLPSGAVVVDCSNRYRAPKKKRDLVNDVGFFCGTNRGYRVH